MKLAAIVLAAGKGLRLESKIPKPLARINSKPVIIYSLETLSRHPLVKYIILVVNSKNSKSIIKEVKKLRIKKIEKIIQGGRRRQDSVLNGLKALDNDTHLVLIHDAARPFIDKDTLSGVIKTAKESGAAIVGVPVKSTIKRISDKFIVKETIERKGLWEIQTPQVFKKDLILRAYKKFGKTDVTDDAMLVERLGEKVSVVLGSYNNIKITTPEDLKLAKAITKRGV